MSAPIAPNGFRRDSLDPSWIRIVAMRPAQEMNSMTGGVAGTGRGVGITRSFKPSDKSCALVTVCTAVIVFAMLTDAVLSSFFAAFLFSIETLVRVDGVVAIDNRLAKLVDNEV